MAAGRVLTAGRSESNDIAIEHPTVSRRHIELRINGDGSFDVFDLGAAAGTFVFHNGEWTRFGHATVAGDERLRLGSYETTAGALVGMAGEGAGGEPARPVVEDAGMPREDIHEVATRRRGERRPGAAGEGAGEDAGEERRTTRRRSEGAPKKAPKTLKLPAHHASSKAGPGPAGRSATPREKPRTTPLAPPDGAAPETARPTEPPIAAAGAAADTAAPRAAVKSLVIAYLLWLFLGGFGAHRFYLGSIGIGITHAALLVVGVVPVIAFGGALFEELLPSIFASLGIAVLTGLVVWWIVDAFLIPGLVGDRRDGSRDRR